jgi:NADH-quinone oxidoreductase subunit E
MLPKNLKEELQDKIAAVDHPRELVVDVLFALQRHYGYVTDKAVEEAAQLLGMTPVEVDEVATFYTFVYRRPVGRYVIHVCDSVICWLEGGQTLQEYLSQKLSIAPGQTTADGLFTLLPVCCIGYCDRAPAMLVNKKVYGPLTTKKIDRLLAELKDRG